MFDAFLSTRVQNYPHGHLALILYIQVVKILLSVLCLFFGVSEWKLCFTNAMVGNALEHFLSHGA